ncbi:helix-turn-helix domain-containing protein [Chitinimonas sp.]|uniref:AraC family transcriptional regulator n=1 Tax=Chitinimonas sp. TaxID=1934313 RepID=UPI002F93AC2A
MYLWRGRALVLGVDTDSTPHAHHAIQLSLALEGEFRLAVDDGPLLPCRAAILWPGQQHKIAANGALIAHLFIDPGYRLLKAWQEGGARPEADPALCHDLLDAWRMPRPLASCEALLERWQAAWLPGFERAPVLDARVTQALQQLAADPELGADALAAAATLSTSRFSHLFRLHTGLPFRRYQLWMRLLAAVDKLATGANLTTAAHAAGFADLAHMSRVFHATFGVVPSTLSRLAIISG